MPLGQPTLNLGLVLDQLIHRLIEVFLIHTFESELFIERGRGGVDIQHGAGGEFALGLDHPRGNHAKNQSAEAGMFRGNQFGQLKLVHDPQDGRHLSVLFAALNVEGVVYRLNGRASFEENLDSLDDLHGEFGEIGQGSFLDVSIDPFGLSNEPGGIGVSIGDSFDVHG